jgi:phospholipase/lecithinase/hemolysin
MWTDTPTPRKTCRRTRPWFEELYGRGARQILIESQFDIHPMTLMYFGPDRSLPQAYRDTSRQFNEAVLDALQPFMQSKSDLRITYVDMYARFYDVLLNPAQYGFTETKVDALDDPALIDKSFNGAGADYVLWNCCHPTSKLHGLIADWHLEALNDSVVEELGISATSATPAIVMKRLLIGRDYTLQSSFDLATWTDLQTFTAVAGTNQWAGSSLSSRANYFRLKWQP